MIHYFYVFPNLNIPNIVEQVELNLKLQMDFDTIKDIKNIQLANISILIPQTQQSIRQLNNIPLFPGVATDLNLRQQVR